MTPPTAVRTTGLSISLVLLALVLPASPAAARACPDAGALPTAGTIEQARSATLCLVNRERTSRGRRALRTSPALGRAASRYSLLMVSEGFFSHVTPAGSTLRTRVRRSGYAGQSRNWAASENLGWGAGPTATPSQMVAAWMRSSQHRANILARGFRHFGVGIAVGAPFRVGTLPTATYTLAFGRR